MTPHMTPKGSRGAWRTAALFAACLLAVAATPGALASQPAKKVAAAPIIAAPNGTVGIQTTVSVSAPTLANQVVNVSLTYNGTVTGQLAFQLNSNGNGSAAWTPAQPGTWTLGGVGALASASPLAVTASSVSTITTLSTVNAAQPGSPSTMVVTVQPTQGTYQPLGTVTMTNGAGTTYGTVTLEPYGSGLSYGTFAWTPPSTGTYAFTANYNQSSGALASSSTNSLNVVPTAPLVSLRIPTKYTIGLPVVISTVINNVPNVTGSAGFAVINGNITNYIGGSVPLNFNGIATTSWTPSVIGYQVLQTQFSSTDKTLNGVATQAISVSGPGPADPMSVSVQSLGVLNANTPVTARQNSQLPVTTSSGSGAAVNLSESGPCFLKASTLVIPAGRGTCTLTAMSPGGGNYSSNTATFVVNFS